MISDELKKAREQAVTGLTGSKHYIAFLLCTYQAISAYLRDSLTCFLVTYFEYFRSLIIPNPNDPRLRQKRNIAFLIDFMTTTFPNMMICVFPLFIVEISIGTLALSFVFQCLSHKKIVSFAGLWRNPQPTYTIETRVVSKSETANKVHVWFYYQANTFLMIGIFKINIQK